MKKIHLALLMLIAVASIASATTSYIKIQYNGVKYIVHPSSEQAYQQSVAKLETDVWFFSSEKDVNELAQAGIFGSYDSYDQAFLDLKTEDPLMTMVYKPPTPPSN